MLGSSSYRLGIRRLNGRSCIQISVFRRQLIVHTPRRRRARCRDSMSLHKAAKLGNATIVGMKPVLVILNSGISLDFASY